MSIVRTYSVFCDGEDDDGTPCADWIAETTEGVPAARRVAKRGGWVREDGRDLCPEHRPSRPDGDGRHDE